MKSQLVIENFPQAHAEIVFRRYMKNVLFRIGRNQGVKAEILDAIIANVTISGNIVQTVSQLQNATFADIENFFGNEAMKKVLALAEEFSTYSPSEIIPYILKGIIGMNIVITDSE